MKTLTGNVGGGNPFAAGGSTALSPVNRAGEVATTYKANFLGVEINFAVARYNSQHILCLFFANFHHHDNTLGSMRQQIAAHLRNQIRSSFRRMVDQPVVGVIVVEIGN